MIENEPMLHQSFFECIGVRNIWDTPDSQLAFFAFLNKKKIRLNIWFLEEYLKKIEADFISVEEQMKWFYELKGKEPDMSHADPVIYGLSKWQARAMRLNYLNGLLDQMIERFIPVWYEIFVSQENKKKIKIKKLKALIEHWQWRYDSAVDGYNKWPADSFEYYMRIMDAREASSELEILRKRLAFLQSNRESIKDIDWEAARHAPIIPVIESYGIKVRRSGNKRYVCLCPFHNEKTPSCTIYDDQSSFYCQGCGKGGSVIDFVMLISKLPVQEAAKKLANMA